MTEFKWTTNMTMHKLTQEQNYFLAILCADLEHEFHPPIVVGEDWAAIANDLDVDWDKVNEAAATNTELREKLIRANELCYPQKFWRDGPLAGEPTPAPVSEPGESRQDG